MNILDVPDGVLPQDLFSTRHVAQTLCKIGEWEEEAHSLPNVIDEPSVRCIEGGAITATDCSFFLVLGG